MAKIITVYTPSRRPLTMVEMSVIRWVKISEALARLGHEVDLATNAIPWPASRSGVVLRDGVRRVPLGKVRWDRYDVVKTLFHMGFETLQRYGGATHPYIIAKLGSVVGPADMEGIYFHGRVREHLFALQKLIDKHSRYVTVLSEPAGTLWRESHGRTSGLLLVPGAVDVEVPPPGPDPFPADPRPRCLFAGNIYRLRDQPEANRVLVGKLNELGRRLADKGIALYFLGSGYTRALDRRAVIYLGVASYAASWGYLHHAHAGVVVAAGCFMHNNESTKIYHYLRAGLPVVSEAGFPNDHVVTESGLGTVTPNGDMEGMAEAVRATLERDWDRTAGTRYVLDHHTWDRRAATYDRIIRSDIR
jgi:glycosyltransferase involved in cell wall biosynthesis